MGLNKHLAASAAFAAIAGATPQLPNLAAVNAAPSVANGPSLVVNPDGMQTASLFTSFKTPSATTAASVAASPASKRELAPRGIFGSDVSDTAYDAQFGAAAQLSSVSAGVSYWISGGSTHNFYGNLNNNGRIVVSQTSYLKQNPFAGGQTCDWVGHDANNGNLVNNQGALIQLNDYGSASAPTYDWYLHSMNNSGTLQWCGRGDTGGSTFQLYSDVDAYNTGLISFEQYYSNYGASFVWRNPTLTTTNTGYNLYNNGAFRIINVVYHNVQNVYGNGCWEIGQGGVLYLEDGTGVYQNPTAGPSFPNQSISFQDSTSVLHMDTAVYSRNSNFGPRIYGFAQGNAIEFYQTIQSYSYSSSTGVLNVAFVGGYQVNIKMGLGYTASKFAKRNNPQKYNTAGYNAIFYDGTAPSQSVPSQCSISAPQCSGFSGGLPPWSGTSSSVSASTSSSSVSVTTSSSSVPVTTITSSVPVTTSSSSVPVTTSSSSVPVTTSSSSVPATTSSSSAPITSSTSSSTVPVTSSSSASSSSVPATTPATKTCPASSYSPYYPALATGYTTDPALTGTTTAGQPCPTTPEQGTYCGFINPEDPCAPQPDGYGPVPTPDTASAFLAYSSLHALASAAPTFVPSSDKTAVYTQVFKDLNASTSAQSYLGLFVLDSYNVTECAAKCDCTNLCTAFNLYAERDPSLAPSANDSTAPTVWGTWCPNPPSMTSFKCTLWGSSIDASSATNAGQYREQFQVVVTASDGWDKTNATTAAAVAGFSAPVSAGQKAINAPQYFLGSRFFPGPFNPQVCGDFAFSQRAANQQAGAGQTVAMFNAYYLNKNGEPYGTYCALYNSVLDAGVYATWSSGVTGGDSFTCEQSWLYTIQA